MKEKKTAISIRILESLKKKISKQAKENKRSLTNQVTCDLESIYRGK